jgi:hypothetical protein
VCGRWEALTQTSAGRNLSLCRAPPADLHVFGGVPGERLRPTASECVRAPGASAGPRLAKDAAYERAP